MCWYRPMRPPPTDLCLHALSNKLTVGGRRCRWGPTAPGSPPSPSSAPAAASSPSSPPSSFWRPAGCSRSTLRRRRPPPTPPQKVWPGCCRSPRPPLSPPAIQNRINTLNQNQFTSLNTLHQIKETSFTFKFTSQRSTVD